MGQRSYSEANNSSACHKISYNLWNLKFHHRAQKKPDICLYSETDTTPSHLNSLPSILILYYNLHLCLPSGLFFPSGFPTLTLHAYLFSPICGAQYFWIIQTMKPFIMQFDPSSSFFLHLRPKYFPQKPFQTPSDCVGSSEASAVTKLADQRNKPRDQNHRPKGVENFTPAL